MLVVIISVYVIYKLFTYSKFINKITGKIKTNISRSKIIESVSFEELTLLADSYGVSSIEVCKHSPMLDKTIAESDLRESDVTVLALERKQKLIPNPSAGTKILLNDKLRCFGKLNALKNELCEDT